MRCLYLYVHMIPEDLQSSCMAVLDARTKANGGPSIFQSSRLILVVSSKENISVDFDTVSF